MGRNKKPFIKKENAVKFYLVHRSQKDPLFLDENAGERVLLPADPDHTDENLVRLLNHSSSKKDRDTAEEIERRRLEQHKYGIYFDDDYNYLQHLKEVDEDIDIEADKEDLDNLLNPNKPKLQLPSSVFASKYEEDVGYFNQAAPDNDPKIGWDPDIVETLDEETKYDFNNPNNELEDDFFLKANADGPIEEEDDDDDQYEDVDDDEEGDLSDYSGKNTNNDDYEDDDEDQSLEDFEKKTQFTNYSMSSSVIRRNEKLKYLDDHFEKVFSQYDEDQIGALDTEEIDGYRGSSNEVMESALKQFEKLTLKVDYKQEKIPLARKPKLKTLNESNDVLSGDGEEDDDEGEEESEEDEEYVTIKVKERNEDADDCESIISTYSNIYNRPALISEAKKTTKIRISTKTGLPIDDKNPPKEKKLSQKQLEKLDHKITQVLPEMTRDKNESKEEKKERKQAIKQHRRERRVEKKINKMAFKEETKRIKSQLAAKSGTIDVTTVKLT